LGGRVVYEERKLKLKVEGVEVEGRRGRVKVDLDRSC